MPSQDPAVAPSPLSKDTHPVGEVWDKYLSLGTVTPDQIGSHVLKRYITLAQDSTEQGSFNPHRTPGQLLGILHYELGIAQQRYDSKSAGDAFQKALEYLSPHQLADHPYDHLRQESLFSTIRLLHARTKKAERTHHIQQRATTREMGSLIIWGCDVSDSCGNPGLRSRMYGSLSEVAFMGAFYAQQSPNVISLGLPASPRQDRPRTLGKRAEIVASPSATDINLYKFVGASNAHSSVTRVQIKANETSGLAYDEDILVLFGDRDLNVRTYDEMRTFGESLAAFSGEPDRTLSAAFSNLDLAQRTHYDKLAS
jgi:hypothetical protein